jgi:hypothetical protein
MGKRNPSRDHPDPEYRRWARRYPRFPGVPECVRLIRDGQARRVWADIIAQELSAHAAECLPELVAAFRGDRVGDVRLYVMMALDLARPSGAVEFLAEVLQAGDSRYAPYAERALVGIGTAEARTVLWEARQAEHAAAPDPAGE